MALVLKSALLVISHKRPQWRYLLSSLAMLFHLILPIITFIIIFQREISLSRNNENAQIFTALIQELKQPDTFFNYQEWLEFMPTMLPYLALCWLVCITLLSSKLFIELQIINKLPKHSFQPDNQLLIRFNELAEQIHLTKIPQLLISLKVDVPMAIGWLKPVVLIPASMVSGLNSSQLEMLLLHELAHIRRHDYVVNFLQTLVEILLFFHPAVHWVSKQMRNEREYCSDDIAVSHCGDAIAYAHTLADTASLCSNKKHQHHTIPNMAMAASGGDLKQRVIRLVDHHCAPQNNVSKWLASAIIIFSVLLFSSQQLLTMSLLNLWHSDLPWKNVNNNVADNESNDTDMTSFGEKTIDIAHTSIANQLLTPIEKKVRVQSDVESSSPVIKSTPELNKSTDLAPSVKKVALTDTRKVKEPIVIATPKSDIIKENLESLSTTKTSTTSLPSLTVNEKTSMVEQAFKNTESHNPFAQELNALASKATPLVSSKKPVGSPIELRLSSPKAQPLTKKNNTEISTNKFQNELNDLPVFLEHATLDKHLSKTTEPDRVAAHQLRSVAPTYPSIAKRKGIEIELKVNFTIGIDGHIKNIQFDHQNKMNYFKNAIRSAMKQWRFTPAKVNNQAVESKMSKVFAFSLKQ